MAPSTIASFRGKSLRPRPVVRTAGLLLALFPLLLGPALAGEEDPGAAAGKDRPAEPEASPKITQLLGFGLGWQTPLMAPGQPIPIVVVAAWGDEMLGKGSKLRGRFESSVLKAYAQLPVSDPWFAGVRGACTIESGQCAPYRYDGGERLKPLEIKGTCAGGGPFVGARVAEGIEAFAFSAARYVWYMRKPETGTGLVLPPDHSEFIFGLEASADRMDYFQSYQIASGWEANLRAEYFFRDAWAQWGFPGEGQTRPGPSKEGASISASGRAGFRLFRHHNLRFGVQGAAGLDLDALSAFRPGSLVGSPTLPGFYFGEILADRYLFAECRYGLNLWEGARGWALAKTGGYREVEGPCRGAFCVSVGLTQKIFFGIPVTLEYAFSPSAERETGGGGHEVNLIVVGAIQ
jgi:hypothetical protein